MQMHGFYEVYFYYGNGNECHVEKCSHKELGVTFIRESCNCELYL